MSDPSEACPTRPPVEASAIGPSDRDVIERKRAEELLRSIASQVRCLLWHAEVEETGEPLLDWKMSFVDEAAAERFLPVARVVVGAKLFLRLGQQFLPERLVAEAPAPLQSAPLVPGFLAAPLFHV